MTCWGLLVGGLLLGPALAFYEAPSFPVEPRGYRIDLHPLPGEGTYKGRVRIDIVNWGPEPLSKLELNADSSIVVDPEIKLIKLANADLSDEESEEDTPISVSSVERENDSLIIHCSQKLPRDATYQLDIKFENKLGSDSQTPFYQGSYTEKEGGEQRWFAVYSSKIGETRKVFPCFDLPYIKSWFELSVVHKKGLTALSNMPVLEQSNMTREGNLIRSQFSRTPPMTVASLGLFVSDFKMPEVEYLQTDGIRIGLWGRPEIVPTLRKAQQVLPSVLVSLELYLSRPYPLPHLNLIALPGYTEERPLNSWGLQWFRESDLMNGNSYWLTHRVAKAAAMQWLSHLASPVNDTPVTTGLASFLATSVAKQLEPTMFHWNLGSFHTLVLELGKPRNYGLDSEQKRSLVESRVFLLLQMFEQVFGSSTFKQSIQNFLAKKEFKSYAEDDLWQVISEQAWTDKKLALAISLGEVVQGWLTGRLPLVTVATDYQTNTTSFTQVPTAHWCDLKDVGNSREKYLDNLETSWSKTVKKGGVDKERGWWIPLVAAVGSSEPAVVCWLSPTSHSLSLTNISTSSFIVLNPGSTGPYIVNYDSEGWKRLIAAFKTLPITYRAQLLHDSLSLALSGHLDTVTALEVTSGLKTEQAPEVWRAFFPLADRLRNRFQGTQATHNLDAYLKSLLIPVLDALGEDDKSSWKTELRVRTKHLLCQTGFSPCVEGARTSYALWLNASSPDEGIPIASGHLCPVMAWGSFEEWQFAVDRLQNFPANRSKAERTFLMKTVAGCPHDPKKYETLLNITFLNRKNNKFSDEDRFIILSALSGESIGYTTLFNFLKSNWFDLKKRVQGNLWEYFIQTAMGNFRTEEGLKEVTELLNERRNEFGTALKAAEDSISRVEGRVKWAKETTPAVSAWLNKTLEEAWTPQRFKFHDISVVSRKRTE